MQWGQIKTLLIVSFLILDVYLFMQFLEKKAEADIGVLEQHTSTIEEQLADDQITYESLPSEEYEETYISVQQRLFTEEELEAENKRFAQTSFIINNNFIVSKVEDTVEIKESFNESQITEVFKQLVYFAEEYTFWSWNEVENVIIFFQEKENRPVYYNQNGLVLLFLNEANEVSFYLQTMLGETEYLAEKRQIMKPMQAIETLYRANELRPGDHINKVDIGFHTRVPFETGVQVFAPIWKVEVNEEKHFFINAIEGYNFSTNETEFIQDAIQVAIDKMQPQHNANETLEEIYNELQEKEHGFSGGT